MIALDAHSSCQYLTSGGDWRNEDHHARVIVKSVKGETFNGYYDATVDGKTVRLTEANRDISLELAGNILASKLLDYINSPVTLIPVPNSHVVADTPPNFRTFMLAEAVARHSKGLATAIPAIRWKSARTAQHQQSGYRHASHFIPNLLVPRWTASPVVLIDDVITSGSQLLACTYLLRRNGIEVPFGLAVGRATPTQMPNPLGWASEVLTQTII